MVRARTCRGHGKSVSFAISKHFTKDLKVACESPMGFAIPSMAAQFLSSRFDAIRSRRHAGARGHSKKPTSVKQEPEREAFAYV